MRIPTHFAVRISEAHLGMYSGSIWLLGLGIDSDSINHGKYLNATYYHWQIFDLIEAARSTDSMLHSINDPRLSGTWTTYISPPGLHSNLQVMSPKPWKPNWSSSKYRASKSDGTMVTMCFIFWRKAAEGCGWQIDRLRDTIASIGDCWLWTNHSPPTARSSGALFINNFPRLESKAESPKTRTLWTKS